MKIYVNARFLTQPVSGVQRYGIECSRKIKKIYPDTVFLTPHDIWNKEVAAELGATVIGSKTGHGWEQWDLPSYLRKNGSPPLFSPCNTAPLLYRNNFVTLHDLAFFHHPEWNSRLFSMWYNFLMPRLARRSKHIFTVSKTIRTEIATHYHIPLSQISVTYNGISAHMIAARNVLPAQKEKIILSVGSFNARKNHHLLIQVFMASNIKTDYTLVIIGDKNKVFSETGIDEADLVRNNIQVLRQLPEDELIAMYQRAAVVVSLSAYEGFGIPVLEGLFNGCKVVCSSIPVYKELYADYAFFCDTGSIDSIVAAIHSACIATTKPADELAELFMRYNYDTAVNVIIDKMRGP